MKYLLLIIILSNFLISCDEKQDTSNNNHYNVIFIMPNKTESYIGTVKGLSACKYIAGNYYFLRRSWIKSGWDYKCCLKTTNNECETVEKYNP
jgi:hypothetical protein